MVSVPNIERVIASIKGELPETQHLGFNMGGYVSRTSFNLPDHSGRNCAWVGCIAGHAYTLSTGELPDTVANTLPDPIDKIAGEFLQIDENQARELFFDLPSFITLAFVPQSVALEVLERLKEAGTIEWEKVANA
jgi:hypothetical protein